MQNNNNVRKTQIFTWKTLEREKTTVPMKAEKYHYEFFENTHTMLTFFSCKYQLFMMSIPVIMNTWLYLYGLI